MGSNHKWPPANVKRIEKAEADDPVAISAHAPVIGLFLHLVTQNPP
jgi:hypothetical protein